MSIHRVRKPCTPNGDDAAQHGGRISDEQKSGGWQIGGYDVQHPQAGKQQDGRAMKQGGQYGGTDGEGEAECCARRQAGGLAELDGEGLEIAFQPSRSLPDPGPNGFGGFFHRLRGDHIAAISQPGQTETQIGIFGDIIGVPSSGIVQRRAPEMIAGSAQR